MDKGLIAKARAKIDAPLSDVWDALTQPAIIKKYMFGTDVVSDWKEGSPIVWRGVWKEKPYEDKGTILQIKPKTLLQYTHYSPLAGAPDTPDNYHTLTYELTEGDGGTIVSLSQDNNADEKEAEHSKKMWEEMLASLKKLLEE